MPKVTLISHTENPEKIVAAAAKLCYSASSVDTLLENLTPEKTQSFVEMLAQLGHESPMEHVSFTFAIEGVSRSLLAQITRHRIASYSVQSQRYVRETDMEYITPPEIAAVPAAQELFEQAMEAAQASYKAIAEKLKAAHTARLIAEGEDEKSAARKAEKLAIEDARFVLPNACETKMVVTMNARGLLNFFRHRCCNRAQWEIREVANQMLELVYERAPTLFGNAGPPCAGGPCAEGKMTCGKIIQVRQQYKEMKERIRGE
ncbi:FAD-dependent thymidylate synthase [Oscillospiraceae bacterium MB08-C2-2]|nr:FAD-dependent thymidylate synthase [Oscillospiraceae bacterium MB08-C2-2]